VLARLARVLLAVALLAGWQAALEHPLAHVDELGKFVHLHSGHSHEDGSDPGSLCDLLAALTACAAHAQAALARHIPDFAVPSQPLGAPRPAQAPPFRSQGPPASV
jgi:hypothetical protein